MEVVGLHGQALRRFRGRVRVLVRSPRGTSRVIPGGDVVEAPGRTPTPLDVSTRERASELGFRELREVHLPSELKAM